MMAKDSEWAWLLERLEKIPHLQRLRIHSRLPVVIPERITDEFCDLLLKSPLQTVFVTHINHPNEIDEELAFAMQKLVGAKVTLLNQSVLLKDVNDNPHTLKVLSDKLFQAGISAFITCICWIKCKVRAISIFQMRKRYKFIKNYRRSLLAI